MTKKEVVTKVEMTKEEETIEENSTEEFESALEGLDSTSD
jgi:hypothetical protein